VLDSAALAALNHLLQGASWARTRLAPFVGKTVRLSLPPLQLHLMVTGEGMFEQSALENFDVEITLPADAPLLALRGAEAVFKAARISGLAEFADALGFVLRNLRWDFEEDLSQHVGDIVAHRLAGLLSALATWQRQAAQHLAENVAEYLTEENPTLAKPAAVAAFAAATDRLGDDLRQLEQRVARLGG
jgi:ubiquinone biosynthesis protein UbiJ